MTNLTFADLKPGSIVSYNDAANVDLRFAILDNFQESYVNVLNLETYHVEPKFKNTKIDGSRWTLLQQS